MVNHDVNSTRPGGQTVPLLLLAALTLLMPTVTAAQGTAYHTLYSFTGDPDGAQPQGSVVIGKAGALYGTTNAGGTSKLGTVFELTPTTTVPWEETVLHDFSGPDGEYPASTLVFGGAGALYGTTGGGGGGSGAIFELAPPSTSGGAWTETVLYAFGGGQNVYPIGGLLIGPGGTLYTTTRGGGVEINLGSVIALSPPATPGGEWTEDQLYTFGAGDDGEQPMAGVVSEGGSLFGTTLFGGDEGVGTVYELTPPATHGDAWMETTIHTFPGSPDGEMPGAALTVGPGGVLYGTTTGGGGSLCPRPFDGPAYGCGVVFQLTPPATPGGAWTESVIYSFTGINGDGAVPFSSVIVDNSGSLYGTTQNGGSATTACPGSYYVYPGCGTVFQLIPPAAPGGAWTEKVLHSFSDADGDGSMPLAGLALSSTGVLFGTTSAGGTAGKGTVFAIKP